MKSELGPGGRTRRQQYRDWRAARRQRWIEKQVSARRDAPGVHADLWKGGKK